MDAKTDPQAMQDAFERSRFYFAGEGPADRTVSWSVWREAWAAAVAAERERILKSLPGGHSVDPQWVADMVRGLA